MSKPLLDPNCFNCNHPIAAEEIYCANCGQKHHDGKYSVGEVITEFISANFNLDAKIFQTLLGLFRPGFLTTQYFKGIHKRYYKPVRLFLVLGIIVFAIMSPEVENTSNFLDELKERQADLKYQAKWDSLKTIVKSNTNDIQLIDLLDSTNLINIDNLKGLSGMIDSIVPDSMKNEDDNLVIDVAGTDVVFNPGKDSMSISGKVLPSSELIEKTPKEFIHEHFEEKPWYNKIILTQILKLAVDGGGLISFLTNRLPIFMLLLTPMYALVFWLLYLRRKRYFVEHFVFVLHLNSAALILVLLFYGLTKLTGLDELVVISLPIYFGYYYFALKKYYQQSYRKTFLKFILINFASIFVGTIALLLILFIGILFF